MTNSPTLTYTLEEVLARFEQKIDRQFADVNQKLDKIDARFEKIELRFDKVDERLNKLEIGQATLIGEIKALDKKLSGEIKALDEKLSGEIKTLDEKLSGEIKTLDQKTDGIGKRLDNQEFINRGVLVAVIVALVGGAAKIFGWLPVA
jgi:chromosome segregation ATPase